MAISPDDPRLFTDHKYFQSEIAPLLPTALLDFHAHAWQADQWLKKDNQQNTGHLDSASVAGLKGARYMATRLSYSVEDLLNDAGHIFPGKEYWAVCFGQPTPAVDLKKTNLSIAENALNKPLIPLRVTKKGEISKEQLRREITAHGFWGYKVFLDWIGDNYANIGISDMLGDAEMSLANELSLIVLLHVPGSRRLADPAIQKGVQMLAENYPASQIVLAHCGRCYLPSEIKQAIPAIKNYPNVYLDTSMVMDSTVLQIIFNEIDSSRVLFATDFPVAAMRGRRVRVMDHWVDVVLDGYPESDYRVGSDRIRASFMAYEIIVAITDAAELAGLNQGQTKDIFFNNGFALLNRVNTEQTDSRQLIARLKRGALNA